MRKVLGALVGAGLIAAATAPTAAMEFTVNAERPHRTVIFGEGLIEKGDAARFRHLVRQQSGREVVLVVNSAGGALLEGGEIAEWVARWRIPVMVAARRGCASACFLILAASPERMAFRSSRIGVHSASSSLSSGETLDTLAVTTLMARAAGSFGVPQSVIGRMVTTGPGDMAWLSEADLRAMRVEVFEEPSFAALAPTRGPSDATQPPTAPSQALTTTPSRLAPAEGSPSFQRGIADRTAWERWFGSLPSGGTRNGAEWWAGQRGLPKPASCESSDAAFGYGCMEANRRLTHSDARRRTDPEYRRGWNSY